MTPIDLESYRRRAEEFTGELDREYYLHFAGHKETAEFATIYEHYPELFARATVDELEATYGVLEGEDKRRLAFLLNFTVDGFMGEQTKELADEIANTEGQASILVDGEQISYRSASVVQANEADPGRRRRIQRARLDLVSDVLNPLYGRQWRTCHALARDLGYDDYYGLYSEVRAIDYSMLRAQTETFLQDTEGLYQRSLEKLVHAKLGIRLSKLDYADLPYLTRAPEYDPFFRADRLLPTLEATLAGIGIDLHAQTNVHIDAEARENKSPRAFCAPVRVPDEIYLVVMPKGGHDDFVALLHEAGHTEHFAHAGRELPFEYRYLGDNAVTEAFAFTFDHLALNPRWLDLYLGYGDARDYLTFANVLDLYFLRRYAGKLSYECELHRSDGDPERMADIYHETLSAAMMVDVPRENYLVDVDAGFYAASYLRAWMLEGALRMLLQDRHGMEWFRDAEAGAWIKELWSCGQQYRADKLLLMHGGGQLGLGPLKQHLERALGR